MAKRRGRPAGSQNGQSTTSGIPENVGAALGRVAAKLDGWLAQRAEIARELNDVINRAQGMLSQIADQGTPWPFAGGRRGKAKATTPSMVGSAVAATNEKQLRERGVVKAKKFTMSEEARRRISEAQKARWAAQKAAAKKGKKTAS
jgi:hypothetical protein